MSSRTDGAVRSAEINAVHVISDHSQPRFSHSSVRFQTNAELSRWDTSLVVAFHFRWTTTARPLVPTPHRVVNLKTPHSVWKIRTRVFISMNEWNQFLGRLFIRLIDLSEFFGQQSLL